MKKLTDGEKQVVKTILVDGTYEEVMRSVKATIGHEVYEYVLVNVLIEIIRKQNTK